MVLNDDDDCPNDAGASTQDVRMSDDDGDGYSDSGDAFPTDARNGPIVMAMVWVIVLLSSGTTETLIQTVTE